MISRIDAEAADSTTSPEMGILAWENELEQHPGNLIHPRSFDFPVRVARVPGACYETVVVNPDDRIRRSFVETAKWLESTGVRFIISTTGLSVIFQRAIAEAVSIPVVTSSLLLVPMVSRIIGPDKRIGVIVASKRFFSPAHLSAAGIGEDNLCIEAIDHTAEFRDLALKPTQLPSDDGLVEQAKEILQRMRSTCPGIGAVVVEVTGLCGQSGLLRRLSDLPVFDIVELAYMMRQTLVSDRWTA